MSAETQELNPTEKDVTLQAEAGVIIWQFMVHMQNSNIWPHHRLLGEASKPITAVELKDLIDEYRSML